MERFWQVLPPSGRQYFHAVSASRCAPRSIQNSASVDVVFMQGLLKIRRRAKRRNVLYAKVDQCHVQLARESRGVSNDSEAGRATRVNTQSLSCGRKRVEFIWRRTSRVLWRNGWRGGYSNCEGFSCIYGTHLCLLYRMLLLLKLRIICHIRILLKKNLKHINPIK